MELRVDPEARAVFRSMPPGPKKKMRAALQSLTEDPSGHESKLDVCPLRVPGDPPLFRLRIGNWRAAFLVRRDSIDVMRLFHRVDGCGWMERMYP